MALSLVEGIRFHTDHARQDTEAFSARMRPHIRKLNKLIKKYNNKTNARENSQAKIKRLRMVYQALKNLNDHSYDVFVNLSDNYYEQFNQK
ncbi:MAG: hypothetical protein QNK11_05750, partial [Legionella sp.]|nr:hypothetical protein [Legionella sp.]